MRNRIYLPWGLGNLRSRDYVKFEIIWKSSWNGNNALYWKIYQKTY